jgi:asparagine synthase (glutamine-hydrolysing)
MTIKQKRLSSVRSQCHALPMAIMTAQAPRSSGIYGLFNLDGAPIDARDALTLGLAQPTESLSWQASGHDAYFERAVSSHQSELGFTLIVGEIEETEALAAALGLRSEVSPAVLAEAALKRFGSDLPAELIGEWSLLHRAPSGRLTLMLSAAQRDRLFYTVRGNRVAIAPNLFAVAKVSWVDNTVDESGLLFPLGRARVRARRGDTTMLTSVHQIGAGCSVVINTDGQVTKTTAQVLTEQPRWHGNYGDAVAETEHMLRRIMRTRLARNARVAPLLSGGLDSSLLSWLSSEECGPGTDLLALTSVAPPDSGIADEARFADLVARTLGIENRHIFPSHEVNIYRPPDSILAGGSGPILSNRHCLTNALQIAARNAGATLMIDGTYGEMTATGRFGSHSRWRQMRTAIGRIVRSPPMFRIPKVETMPFHVRLASHRLANLPQPILAAQATPPGLATRKSADGLFGYMPGIEKALTLPNEFYAGAVRMAYPYRDIRLLRLFAGFPVRMLLTGDADRGIARAMLNGHLPDEVRLRRQGMAASPDHGPRLQRQANAARQRIPHFRKAQIDDWLDLDWLDVTLESVATRGPVNGGEADEAQLTAIAAEFLLWWRLQS